MLSQSEPADTAVTQPGAPRPRKYPPLAPELAAELRLAYVGTVREVSANLQRISARTGIPKDRLKGEARKRGWRTQGQRRAWTPREIAYLREVLGKLSVTRIARNLKRSHASVKCQVGKLKLSQRLTGGYNVSDLCELFGLSHTRIESWVKRRLLGEPQGHGGHGGNLRFDETAVVRFIREYPHEYDLGRLDQSWFKELVFDRWLGGGENACKFD
jgi:hypothetical protein